MPWTIIAVAVGAMAAVEASKPIVIHHPGWMRLSCKNCGANLRAGMKECEYCRTDDIWLVQPRDEHVYPSSLPSRTPSREPAPAPSPYRSSQESSRSRRRSSDYSSPSPAPSPWVAPVFSSSDYGSPAPAPSYEPPAPSPAPSFSSGGGGDFGGGGASGDY